jgi:hypothetical protein
VEDSVWEEWSESGTVSIRRWQSSAELALKVESLRSEFRNYVESRCLVQVGGKQAVCYQGVSSNLPSQLRGNGAFFNSCVLVRQMTLLGTKSNRHGPVCGVVYTANVLGQCGADVGAQ